MSPANWEYYIAGRPYRSDDPVLVVTIMPEPLSRLLRWIEHHWRTGGILAKVALAGLSVLVLIVFALVVQAIPGFERVKELFSQARPEVQTAVLTVVAGLAVLAGIWSARRAAEVEKLEAENRRLEVEVTDLRTRWDRLTAVETRTGLWQRPCQVAVPHYIPPTQRGTKTRFITVLNFKGGVGKTTLTANMAACLAALRPGARVLLIDVDFQGTLSAATVEKSRYETQAQNGSLVHRLLTESGSGGDMVGTLAVPMNGVAGAKVIVAGDTLDIHEFDLQARFFVDSTREVRYQFRRHLHTTAVFDQFDFVIFDCPPRVTTSVVNAVVCSDHILIPTLLDRGSIDAVFQTFKWVGGLGAHWQGEILGVVACQTTSRAGHLVKADAKGYEDLRGVVQSAYGADLLFQASVPASSRAVGPDRGRVAALATDGRVVFDPVVTEMLNRMRA